MGSIPISGSLNIMKVYETRTRSLLKAVSFRVIEVVVDTFILSFFVDTHIALGLAIALEFICLVLHYLFERIWNRTQFGRVIEK